MHLGLFTCPYMQNLCSPVFLPVPSFRMCALALSSAPRLLPLVLPGVLLCFASLR